MGKIALIYVGIGTTGSGKVRMWGLSMATVGFGLRQLYDSRYYNR